ncbi:MAG: hypothetical protein EOP50_13205 [Sphingobacteriales bacterium]|nr:MAG: hypothetical protein EOP50_13205 [Sphingobacteriales bacterium]
MQQEQVLTETTVPSTQYLYNSAAQQLAQQQLSDYEITANLVRNGASEEEATRIVLELRAEFTRVKKERAQKDMLYGGLWCAGGTILTIADIGFIFWGAIVFGGIQLVRGLVNYSDV